MAGIEPRKIQKATGNSREPYVRIPIDIGLNPGDVVKFERLNDREVRMIKLI